MFSNLFVKRESIENYFIADVIIVENIEGPYYQVLEENRLVMKVKDSKNQYIDLYNGYYHRAYDNFQLLCGFASGYNRCFKITKALVDYYPFLKSKRITVEEAKKLFQYIPRIELLIKDGVSIEEISHIYDSENTIHDDKKLVRKRMTR